jgi:hypothetical protein
MASVKKINEEIEAQKERLAELEQEKARLELREKGLEPQEKDGIKESLLEFCAASVNLLEVWLSALNSGKISRGELKNTHPDEGRIANLLGEGITEIVRPGAMKPMAKGQLESEIKELLKEWQAYKSSK